MRIVNSKEEVENSFTMATNEALNAFGNGDVYMEKFVEGQRNIEIQILGDKFGNVDPDASCSNDGSRSSMHARK